MEIIGWATLSVFIEVRPHRFTPMQHFLQGGTLQQGRRKASIIKASSRAREKGYVTAFVFEQPMDLGTAALGVPASRFQLTPF